MPTRPADSYPVEAGGTTTGDMANVAALYASLPAEETYVVPGYDRMFEKDSRAVRVIGDSFSEYYMPYLQARFTNSCASISTPLRWMWPGTRGATF